MLLSALAWALIASRNSQIIKFNNSSAESIDQTNAPDNLAVALIVRSHDGRHARRLLVVNKDMRVVASNPAAHKLFNPSVAALKSQRLTELTRNPAIYSAFLDGLKGMNVAASKSKHMDQSDRYSICASFRSAVPTAWRTKARSAFSSTSLAPNVSRLVRQEFLSNVSHELRTPLTAIIAFVETLENGAMEDPESCQRFLSIIRKNASRMHGLIDDILELTAIEGGNVQLRAAPVELRAVVEDVCASLAAKAAAQKVTLQNDVAS